MNPVVRQILDNIGRLGRELEKSQPNPLQTNGGTMSNERTVSVKGEVSRIFRRSSAQPSARIYTSNASFTSTVSNVITTSTSTAAQQGPSNSTNSTLTPHYRLSYNFNNSRAGQNTRKKGETKSDKAPNGLFIKDVILLGGLDHGNVLRQGARLWLMVSVEASHERRSPLPTQDSHHTFLFLVQACSPKNRKDVLTHLLRRGTPST